MFRIVLLVFAALFAASANSALVRHDFIGSVAYAEEDNAYGITTDSIITGYAVYDDNLLIPNTLRSINVGLYPEFQLRITVGNHTFTEDDDTQGEGYPYLLFGGPAFYGLDFNTASSPPHYIDATGSAWGVGLNGSFQAQGDFDFSAFSAVPYVVPIPAAVYLFVSSLLAIVGLKRRSQGRSN